jgi:hypothetical protein
MSVPIFLPGTKRKRGNPHWGQPVRQAVLPTEFETQVERMGLIQSQFFASAELKRWCELNRNRFYIPEWLLDAWSMSVDGNLA